MYALKRFGPFQKESCKEWQLFFEVQRAVNGDAKVIPMNKIGGGELLTPEELYSKIKRSVKK
jgi:hypothetical protein